MNLQEMYSLRNEYLGYYQELDERVRAASDQEKGRLGLKAESYDFYDVVLDHLLDEGYADTYESAEVIMVNMSEEWIDSIAEAKWGKQPYPVKKVERKGDKLSGEVQDMRHRFRSGENPTPEFTNHAFRTVERLGELGDSLGRHLRGQRQLPPRSKR